MRWRDTIERLFWTLVSAFIGGLSVSGLIDISATEAAISATAVAAANFVLLIARTRLGVLPEPGAGLPGLPTDQQEHTT